MGITQAKATSPNHCHIDSYYYITELVIRGTGWALVPEHDLLIFIFIEVITLLKFSHKLYF